MSQERLASEAEGKDLLPWDVVIGALNEFNHRFWEAAWILVLKKNKTLQQSVLVLPSPPTIEKLGQDG